MKKSLVKSKAYVEIDPVALQTTGEIKIISEPVIAPEITNNVPRGGFEIAYLASICDILDKLGNKKIKVLQYLLKNKDGQNCLNITQAELCAKVGCSRQIVYETIKMLTDAGALTKKGTVYRLSPRVIVKGDAQREGYIMQKFVEEREARPKGPKVVAELEQTNIEGQMAFKNADMELFEEGAKYE